MKSNAAALVSFSRHPDKKENMKILQAKFLGGEKGFKEYLFFFCYSCKYSEFA